MKVELDNIGKRYQYDWIFKSVNLTLTSEQTYALTGPNGSGKSTLLRVVAGFLTPTKGEIRFLTPTGELIPADQVYRYVAFAAPYVEMIEEMTLSEALRFHTRFVALQSDLTPSDIQELLGFSNIRRKPLRYFSSGMKQRLRLALAVCSATPLLLLDEPSTNLDRQGIGWYLDLVERYTQNRLVVVASNVAEDYQFCSERIDITDFKPDR